jgi:hypothetical protein
VKLASCQAALIASLEEREDDRYSRSRFSVKTESRSLNSGPSERALHRLRFRAHEDFRERKGTRGSHCRHDRSSLRREIIAAILNTLDTALALTAGSEVENMKYIELAFATKPATKGETARGILQRRCPIYVALMMQS